MEDLGAALRAAREAAGVSLAGMASRTHYSKPLLGLLETGKRRVNPEHVEAYRRALDLPLTFLRSPAEDPLRVAHEWLVGESPAVAHFRSGRRVGASLAEQLERRVVELRHLDDVVGSDELLPVVRGELAQAEQVVRSVTCTERTGRRLLAVVAEFAQLAGWVASDAGRHAQAQHAYLDGVSAARHAGDDVLAAQLLSSLSYHLANVGNPREAALLARSAVKGATGASPVVRALLLERVAWASARSRDRDGTRNALDAVDDAYENRTADVVEPEWVYWLDRGEIDIMAGRCLVELGEPGAAEPLLAGAIQAYHADHVREVALYLSWLAEAYARARLVDAARDTLERARDAARKTTSARLEERIGRVAALVPN